MATSRSHRRAAAACGSGLSDCHCDFDGDFVSTHRLNQHPEAKRKPGPTGETERSRFMERREGPEGQRGPPVGSVAMPSDS